LFKQPTLPPKKTISITQWFSAEIKADVSRSCVSLCLCSVRILLPSATSIVQCFALLPIDFDCMHDNNSASDFDKAARARELDLVGQRATVALQEAMSSAPAPPQAAIASLGIMLSVLRRIDQALLLSVFNFLALCGNFSACRLRPFASFFSSILVDKLEHFAAGRSRACKNQTWCVVF
jgi:hypothetical protein